MAASLSCIPGVPPEQLPCRISKIETIRAVSGPDAKAMAASAPYIDGAAPKWLQVNLACEDENAVQFLGFPVADLVELLLDLVSHGAVPDHRGYLSRHTNGRFRQGDLDDCTSGAANADGPGLHNR